MTITLKQMRYAIAVEQYKHFGRAAQACFVTQPALSQQIALLEDKLGFVIFERMGKSVIPTHRGTQFLINIRHIIERANELEEQFVQKPNSLETHISIALIPTIAPYLLPSLLPVLRAQLSTVQFSVSEQITDNLVSAVKNGECDVGILATEIADQRLVSTPLFADPFVLAVAQSTKLNSPVDLAKLNRENMLLLSEGHCLRDQTIDACHIGDALKQKTFAATSLSTIVELVANNLGMTLLPAMSIQREALGGRIKTLSLKSPGAGRTVRMIWRRSSPLQALFQQVAAITTDAGKQLLVEDTNIVVK